MRRASLFIPCPVTIMLKDSCVVSALSLLLGGFMAAMPARADSPPVEARIIGGKDAEAGKWPTVVALVSTAAGYSLFDRQFCGGTLISPRLVLTAAHCVLPESGTVATPDQLRVVTGITTLPVEKENTAAEEWVVSGVYPHPEYSPGASTLDSDIALLELANEVDIEPATLFDGDVDRYAGKVGSILGWGAVELDEQTDISYYPQELQEASVPIVDRKTCNAPESYAGLITESQFCAGFQQGGVDACSGDSGGPLFLTVDAKPVLTGITSFGLGCAQSNFYGVYTSVEAYLPWIRQYFSDPVTEGGNSTDNGSGDGSAGFGERDEADSKAGSGGGLTGIGWLLAGMGMLFLRRRRRVA